MAPNSYNEVMLAVAKGKNPKAFREEVLKAFGVAGGSEAKVLHPPGRKPKQLERFGTEGSDVQLYVYHQDESYSAAVLFKATKPDQPSIDVSLGTLALGPPAYQKHAQFQARRTPAGK